MNVLSLSLDKKILVHGSENQLRQVKIGEQLKRFDIVVFNIGKKIKPFKLSEGVTVYPTNSKWNFLYLIDALRIGKRIKNIDVITAQESFTGVASYLLKIYHRCKFQQQIHTDLFSPYFRKESLSNFVQYLLFIFLIGKADSIRAVSLRIKNVIKNRWPNKPVVLLSFYFKNDFNGSNAEYLKSKYPDYDFIILMASRFVKVKNISLAIEAMKEISLRFPKTLLLIVGDGPEKINLNKLISKYKLFDNVKIENWTSNINFYYYGADLFLLTSNYEGYGRSVIEAMLSGCPVLMSDVGLAGDLLIDRHNGRTFRPNDLSDLCKILSEMIADVHITKNMGENGFKVKSRLLDEQDYYKLYSKILSIS